HLGLSAHRLYLLLCRFGEGGSLDSEFLGEAAVAEHLHAVNALGEHAGLKQRGGIDLGAVLKAVEGGDVDGLQRLGEDVVEAPLGDTSRKRHLAAFEANADAAAAPGLLALMAAASGLAVARAVAPALALGDLGAAGGG